ncbi:xanthine dehydrogenase family protein molybdopterin-binding subunit [Endozoicomonas arenosclerae]|uniref:xanthine dehydrogenase family protein molybdopterin-binding subunit n=1 Tax=Endozoicomonas arenosclerae TaxID=1633495 RepID=UPI000785FF8C|nr:molybdopterin cofactor-binding domain-containing protein [Endozoicomonas arenosclerae]
MSVFPNTLPSREQLLNDKGILTVFRKPVAPPKPAPGQPGNHTDYIASKPELFIVVLEDNQILAFNGHVDLGTGIRTSLAQIVAEELDVEPARIRMILGDPEDTPNQGPTIASATIQISSQPLQRAAAQARHFLLELAAGHLKINTEQLTINNGMIHPHDKPEQSVSFGELISSQRFDLQLDEQTPVKSAEQHRYTGKSSPRVDIPNKATGQLTFVHDLRLPDMLHGRVVRPPYTGRDQGDYVGNSLIRVDEASIAHIPGIVKIVVKGDFVGIIAKREEQAEQAARTLKVDWKPVPELAEMENLEQILRNIPAKTRSLKVTGNIENALEQSTEHLQRSYLWSYNMHASIGPSCSVAKMEADQIKLWSGTQNPHSLRTDISRLTGLTEDCIEIIRMEASGCYGRNCADDVGADAVLMAQAVDQPVRVQLTRAQEHGWEPKGTAQIIDIEGAIDQQGNASAYRFKTRYPSNDAPNLALLLTGTIPADPKVFEMGDRTSVPPYSYTDLDISCDDAAPVVRSSWLRGVSALPNNFAHESFIDELACLAGEDPVSFRLRHLGDDVRAQNLIRHTADKADWGQHKSEAQKEDGWLYGHGFAYGHYVHSRFPGFGAARAAWCVSLKVRPDTGEIQVIKVTVGQDAGRMINPDGVKHQVHGNIIQSLSRTLKERVTFDQQGVASLEWGGYPILNFTELPEIELALMDLPEEPPLGVGESTSLPCAPAIANALFNATGVRFLQAPFTPGCVRNILKTDQSIF